MIGQQLRRRYCPALAKEQQVCQYCLINSDHENIELEDHVEPLHAWILQDILNVQDQCARHIKLHPKLSETVGFYQKYCDINHPHWVSILKCAELKAFSPPVNQSNFCRRDYFCDVTNTGKQLCSPNEPFVVVLEKIVLCANIKCTHIVYTLTKIGPL